MGRWCGYVFPSVSQTAPLHVAMKAYLDLPVVRLQVVEVQGLGRGKPGVRGWLVAHALLRDGDRAQRSHTS